MAEEAGFFSEAQWIEYEMALLREPVDVGDVE
jgi:hypothetical protein